MALAERAALAGFEVHDVVADRAAFQRQRGGVGFVEQLGRDAEGTVGLLGAADRLEHQVDRRAGLGQLQRVGDVGQHAALRRDLEALDHLVEHAQQVAEHLHAVGGRVEPDHRVAGAHEQAVQRGGRHAAQVVGRMVGLQPHREMAGQADGVAKARDHAALARHRDEVLVAHELGYRGHHLRREPGGQRGQRRGVGLFGQQPVAEVADAQVRHRRERLRVVPIDDEPRDVVFFIGNECLGQELLERRLGQHMARRHALLRGGRAHAGEVVARARRARDGHDLLEVFEGEGLRIDRGAVAHRKLRRWWTTSRPALPPCVDRPSAGSSRRPAPSTPGTAASACR